MVVNVLNELGQYVTEAEVAGKDVEEDQEDIKKGGITTECGVEQLKSRIAEGFDDILLSRMRGVLYADTDICGSAKHFKLDPDSPFSRLDENVVEFLIIPERFEAWKEKHQRAISTKFVCLRTYKCPVEDQHRITYSCQCASQKKVRKDAVRGGKSSKPRLRKEGIKKGCLSKIHALFQPIPMADGSNKPGYVVEYHYQHNHSIGNITDLGTGQKSAAIRATM
ncbi:hypothetical protein BGZ96_001676 [Linnemannia gamsii]|uniref:Uncharacterized protein n=1 Tax=Linnemannia gamsii TaxID=64522 RepID=A0ABQ7K8U4_9FUNG|nr:hypothetical protein BGZ96_001676 [Linnemannia gamsii]